MNELFRFDYRCIMTCSRCGAVEEEILTWQNAPALSMRHPSKPTGWHVVDHSLICDRHSIQIKDKGDGFVEITDHNSPKEFKEFIQE